MSFYGDRDQGNGLYGPMEAVYEESSRRCPSFIADNRRFPPPSFVAPTAGGDCDWIFTINLDQEVLSINNKTHYHLTRLPDKDHWKFCQKGCSNLPSDLLAGNVTSLALPGIIPGGGFSESFLPSRKVVRPKVFARSELGKGLSETLLQWRIDNFAFRELAYSILCIAAGGQYMTTREDRHTKQDFSHVFTHSRCWSGSKRPDYFQFHFQYDAPTEFESSFLSGSHLDSMLPGVSLKSTVYWFSGALIVLVARLQDPCVLEQGLHQILQYRHQVRSFNAVLLSIEHLVLVKVFPEGGIEHTEIMALFKIESHASKGYYGHSPPGPEEDRKVEEANIVPKFREGHKMRLMKDKVRQAEKDAWLTNHPGQTGNPDRTFQTLITFFDAVARERMGGVRCQQGRLPNEIYAMIIRHVLDIPTRNACMHVSPVLRDLCLQEYLITQSKLLLPGKASEDRLESQKQPTDWFRMRDLTTGEEKDVGIQIIQELDLVELFKFITGAGKHAAVQTKREDDDSRDSRVWVEDDRMAVVVGSEINRRSALPNMIGFGHWERSNAYQIREFLENGWGLTARQDE
ncbi:MAG: hypothetical protein Q9168_003925 [Polycauliona sp. 1 TL-2023]